MSKEGDAFMRCDKCNEETKPLPDFRGMPHIFGKCHCGGRTTRYTVRKVTMKWTKEKAIDMLVSTGYYSKVKLKKLLNYDLFELGKTDDLWAGDNPFSKDGDLTQFK